MFATQTSHHRAAWSRWATSVSTDIKTREKVDAEGNCILTNRAYNEDYIIKQIMIMILYCYILKYKFYLVKIEPVPKDIH